MSSFFDRCFQVRQEILRALRQLCAYVRYYKWWTHWAPNLFVISFQMKEGNVWLTDESWKDITCVVQLLFLSPLYDQLMCQSMNCYPFASLYLLFSVLEIICDAKWFRGIFRHARSPMTTFINEAKSAAFSLVRLRNCVCKLRRLIRLQRWKPEFR